MLQDKMFYECQRVMLVILFSMLSFTVHLKYFPPVHTSLLTTPFL